MWRRVTGSTISACMVVSLWLGAISAPRLFRKLQWVGEDVMQDSQIEYEVGLDNEAQIIKLWEVLVPQRMYYGPNSAGPFVVALEYHRRWDEKISKICGGLILHSTTQGLYGTEYESMIQVRIACTESELKNRIIPITKEHYKQEKVLAYLISESVILQ